MSDTYEPSSTNNTHRVRGNPSAKPLPPIIPCELCGAIGVHSFRTEKDPGHVVQCPNRHRQAGRHPKGEPGCPNTITKYRTTHAAEIAAWNHFNNPKARRNYDEIEDMSKPRPLCKCGLSLPCNSCLENTNGFQRLGDHGHHARA